MAVWRCSSYANTQREKKNVGAFTLKVNGYVFTTFLGRSQASRGKHQIITHVYSVWAVAFLTFHKGCFLEDTWKCKQESPLLTSLHPTPHTQPYSPLQLPKCLEGHAASSVYDKGPVSGSRLSVHSKEPVRRKQEAQETETVSPYGWRHLSGKRMAVSW